MIRVEHLTKRYGAHLAVDDVSFAASAGEVVGLLGPNGAGKSTLLRTLAGVLGPTSGTVSIDEHDVVRDSFEARRRLGYMPEAAALYDEMRVLDYLAFRVELKRVRRSDRRRWVDEAMAKAGVLEVAHKRIAHLSKGYRQRVGIADAIVARPPVVILDEPTAGLDPNQIRHARALIRELGREHTVIVSTHILAEIEACATRVLLLHRGKLVAEGPTEAIRALQGAGATAIEVLGRGDASAACAAVLGVTGVEAAADTAREDPDRVRATSLRQGMSSDPLPHPTRGDESVVRLRITFRGDLSSAARAEATEGVVAALVGSDFGVREVRPLAGSLEEVFALLTRSDERASLETSSADGSRPSYEKTRES